MRPKGYDIRGWSVAVTIRNTSFLLAFVAIVLMGCATTQTPAAAVPGQVATTLEVARAHYLRGLASLREGDFESAFKSFSAAARAPSHIEYSKLARLRIADTLFYQDMFDEAAVAYTAFINSSTSNPNLHYAYFRLAECKVKSISGDFFLVPPSDRRDQRDVRSALRAIESFVRNFPDSPYCGQVLQMRDRMIDTVSSYELEVARFYMTRKKPAGAIGRISGLMRDIPATRESEKVRVAYIEALAAADSLDELQRECSDYRVMFPGGRRAAKVADICGRDWKAASADAGVSDAGSPDGSVVDGEGVGQSGSDGSGGGAASVDTVEVGDVR